MGFSWSFSGIKQLTISCGFLSLLAVLGTPVAAQSSPNCNVITVVQAIRAEGYAEPMGDVILQCTGGTPTPAGQSVPTLTIVVSTNAVITSKVTDSNPTSTSAFTEALLLVDEPNTTANGARTASYPILACGQNTGSVKAPYVSGNAGVCTIKATGTGGGVNGTTYNGTNRHPNVFQGRLVPGSGGSQIQFVGVPFDPPAANDALTFRITNIRINAAALTGGLLGSTPTYVYAQTAITTSSNVTLSNANVSLQTGLTRDISLSPATASAPTYSLCGPAPTSGGSITVTEGFPNAWRPKNFAAVQANTIVNATNNGLLYKGSAVVPANDLNQNVPGSWYWTESGFMFTGAPATFDPSPNAPVGQAGQGQANPNSVPFPTGLSTGVNQAGTAANGTRLVFVFSNVPVGSNATVPSVISLQEAQQGSGNPVTGVMVAVSGADANGAGGTLLTSGVTSLSETGPTTVIYEMLFADPSYIEQATVPVTINPTASAQVNQVAQVSYGAAPGYLTSATPNPGIAEPMTGTGSLPLPRFLAANTTFNLWSFVSCSTGGSPNLVPSIISNQPLTQGLFPATFQVVVKNTGNAQTSGLSGVSITLPEGMFGPPGGFYGIPFYGDGWTCTSAFNGSCTRADSLAPGAQFPPILVVSGISPNAPASITVGATAGGGGAGNNSSQSTFAVAPVADVAVRWTLSGVTFSDGATASGSFVYDLKTNTYSHIQITTSQGTSFAGTTYTGATDIAETSTQLPALARMPAGDWANLFLYFSTGLSNAGGNVPLTNASAESYINRRTVSGGSVVGTPMTTTTTTTSLSVSPDSPQLGSKITLGASVAPAMATGVVTFLDSGTFLGTARLSGGVATLQTFALNSGLHRLRAVYNGDLNYLSSVSTIVNRTEAAVAAGTLGPATAVASASFGLNNALARGDFNNDGKLDFLLYDYGTSLLHVLLGNSAGGYSEAHGGPLTLGSDGYQISVADFNNDGNLDLLVTAQGTGVLSLLLGDGTGAFTSYPFNAYFDSSANSTATADFNNDGNADVVVFGGEGIAILLGDGYGGFSAPFRYAVRLSGAVVADMNGDGNADIVGFGNDKGAVTLDALLGNGQGQLMDPVLNPITPIPPVAYTVAVADFNGDSIPDVAVSTETGFQILLNDGTGHLTFNPPVAGGFTNIQIAAEDFDGDGKQDVALLGNGNQQIFYGDGGGNFSRNFMATYAAAAPAITGDFNGDGRVDIIAVSSSGLSIMLGTPPATTGGGPVAFDASVSSNFQWGVTSITTPAINIGTGTGRAAMIMVTMDSTNATNVKASLGGIAATLVPGTDSGSATSVRTMVFAVTNPPSGSQTATVSWTGALDADVGVISVFGADQSTPVVNGVFVAGSSGSSPSTSLKITSNPGDLTASIGYSTDQWGTPATNQALKWGVDSGEVGGDVGPGTGTTTHTWTDKYSFNTASVSGANFKAAGGTAPTPDFALSSANSSATVPVQGGTAVYPLTITPAGGFSGSVTLSVSGLPTNSTASFSPNPAGGSSSLTVTVPAYTVVGSYSFTLTGVSGTLTHSIPLTLVVTAPPDFALAATPTSQTVSVGGQVTYAVAVSALNGFAGSVLLSTSSLPLGVSFSPDPTASTSTLLLNALSNTAPGTYTFTITGTSGSLSHTITATVIVTTAPSFSLSATPVTATVAPGAQASYSVAISPVNGFAGSVNFSVTGLPSGVTPSFSPNPSSTATTLTIPTLASTPPGTYGLTITGTSGALTRTATVNLVLSAPATSVVKFDNQVGSTLRWGVTSITTPAFSIGTGLNRAAMIMVAMDANTATNIKASLGGIAATLVTGTDTGNTTSIRTMIFQVINPPSGSQTATVSWTGKLDADVGVITVTGASQTTPVNNGVFTVLNSAPSASASVKIISNPGDLTSSIGYTADQWVTPFTNQILKWGIDSSVIGGDIGPGTGTTTHTWTDKYAFQILAISGANFKSAP